MLQPSRVTYFSNSKAEENRNCFAFAAIIPPNDLSVGLQGRKMLGYGSDYIYP